MIYFIDGIVADIMDGHIIIENNGVGYLVQAGARTISEAQRGQRLRLYTAMQVKENDIGLIGFMTADELTIFGLLTRVTGVGAKAALSLQSTLNSQDLTLAILTEDVDMLSRAPGVGKKIAQRIALELKDGLKKSDVYIDIAPQAKLNDVGLGIRQEALEALMSLGYTKAESLAVVMEIDSEHMNTEQLIRQALKRLAR